VAIALNIGQTPAIQYYADYSKLVHYGKSIDQYKNHGKRRVVKESPEEVAHKAAWVAVKNSTRKREMNR
jgi:cation transport regulator ChaB